MDVEMPGSWPKTADEALAVQEALRARVDRDGPGPRTVQTLAGLDVAYATGSDRLAAAVVVLDAVTLAPVETATAVGEAAFPYMPGLFAFREIPPLVEALRRLRTIPDVLLCDGHGYAHPRRFGLACHLGVLTGIPSLGVAKTPFIGDGPPPGPERGAWAPLHDGTELVGRVLRTRAAVKPVYVSTGHGVDLDTACHHVLAATAGYRLPETTRRADHLSRRALAFAHGMPA